MTKHRALVIPVLATVIVLALAGCKVPGKVTGGGSLASASGVPGDKANFGFNAAQCVVPGPISGRFNYHDKNASFPGGVKMNGPVAGFGDCVLTGLAANPSLACGLCSLFLTGPQGYTGYGGIVPYNSTNPKVPGSGFALVCLEDTGEGNPAVSPHGTLDLMRAISGPYAPYSNAGPIQGNIQAHTCTCTDGVDNDGDGPIDLADPSCGGDPNGDEE